MTLSDWFKINTRTPLTVLLCFVTLIYGIFIFYAYQSNIENQEKNLNDLIVTSVRIGLQQKDRVLIESVLEGSVNNLGVKAATICNGSELLMSTAFQHRDCKTNPDVGYFHRVVSFQDIGFQNHHINFIVPKYKFSKAYFWLFAVSLFILILSLGIVLRVRKKLEQEILLPLEASLLKQDSQHKIKEFAKLRQKIEEGGRAQKKEAFSQAILESRRKFSHNIASPLRNLKVLSDAIKGSLEDDEQQLFKSIANELTEIANKTKITNPYYLSQAPEPVNSKESLALFDLNEIIESVVREKQLAWYDNPQQIEIEFTNAATIPKISMVDGIEFKSIISNMLNNSKEAGASKVIVATRSTECETFAIKISDDGKGINPKVANTLFDNNVTFGKESGTGYGLYHANKYLSKWDGKINNHKSSRGARFTIELPVISPRPIELDKDQTVVILEDKEFERARLKNIILKSGIGAENIKTFESSNSFLSWRLKNKNENIFLIADNDLGEDQMLGSQVIKNQSLQESSVLFTDGHINSALIGFCLENKLNILPKAFDPIFNLSTLSEDHGNRQTR